MSEISLGGSIAKNISNQSPSKNSLLARVSPAQNISSKTYHLNGGTNAKRLYKFNLNNNDTRPVSASKPTALHNPRQAGNA